MRGEMVEDAWLYITLMIYVEILTAFRDAAAGQRAVFQEIYRQYRAGCPNCCR